MDALFPRPISLVSSLTHQLLVCKLVLYKRQGETKERGRALQMMGAGLISKGTFFWGLSWAAIRWEDFCYPHPRQILKVYMKAVIGFSHIYYPDGLNTSFLSHHLIISAVASENREGKWSTYSKDKAEGGKAPVAQVQLKGQPLILSSWWLSQYPPGVHFKGFLPHNNTLVIPKFWLRSWHLPPIAYLLDSTL